MIFSNPLQRNSFLTQESHLHFPEKFESYNEDLQFIDPYEIEKTQLSEIDIKNIADKISSKLIKIVETHLQKETP